MNTTMTYDVSIMNKTSRIALSILACPAFNVGCAGDKSADRLHEITDARTQADAVVRDTRDEIATVPRNLAAARIAAAKHAAEPAKYQREVNALQAERVELRKMLDLAQLVMSKSQTERDQPGQAQSQTQASAASQQAPPAPTVASNNSLHVDMEDLKARLTKLTIELTQLKHHAPDKARSDSAQVNHESAERSADLIRNLAILEEDILPRVGPNVAFVVPSMGQVDRNTQTPDSTASRNLIHLQPSDSLRKLAHNHANMIDELKLLNRLSTDVVQAAQPMTLLLPISTGAFP